MWENGMTARPVGSARHVVHKKGLQRRTMFSAREFLHLQLRKLKNLPTRIM